jgi:Rps23 Pro-64 3,4-dihydroxylase Tpa1-like proline 4-hydroxylase
VLTFLHPHVRNNVEALGRQFHEAEPFRHVVIDEFLTEAFCRQLIAEFPPFDPEHARNEMGRVGGKAVFQDLRALGPTYAELDRMLRSREFLFFVGRITGISKLLYDPQYVGGGTHENLEGQELDPHVDFNYHPNTQRHRRLNLIVFLNPEWREEWGGALELHQNPWLPPDEDRVKTILPLANRCVIFETTERSWHGFKRIRLPQEKKNLSRRSIAVYYYTRTRPAKETVPEHSTVYVQRGLPENIQAGHTLCEEDVQALRALVTRRDTQIRFLYERELEYMSLVHGILRTKSFRLYRAVTGPARKCWGWIKSRNGS